MARSTTKKRLLDAYRFRGFRPLDDDSAPQPCGGTVTANRLQSETHPESRTM
jgi:hypothetical protein